MEIVCKYNNVFPHGGTNVYALTFFITDPTPPYGHPSPTREGSGYRITRTALPSVGSGYRITRTALPSVGSGYRITRTALPSVGSGYRITRTALPSVGSGYRITRTALPSPQGEG